MGFYCCTGLKRFTRIYCGILSGCLISCMFNGSTYSSLRMELGLSNWWLVSFEYFSCIAGECVIIESFFGL